MDKIVVRTLRNLKPLILLHSAALLRINEPFVGNFNILQKSSSRIRIKLQPKISTLCIPHFLCRVRQARPMTLIATGISKNGQKNFWSSGPEVMKASQQKNRAISHFCNTAPQKHTLFLCSYILLFSESSVKYQASIIFFRKPKADLIISWP